MSMKEAFDTYFEKTANAVIFLRKKPYIEKLSHTGLYLNGTLDNEDYAEWKPVLQDKPVDFAKAESALGFRVSEQIREYLSVYWFLPLDGHFDSELGTIGVTLDMLVPDTDISELLAINFNFEDTNYLNEHNWLKIGGCSIDGDDGWLVMADNETDKVLAVQPVDRKSVHLADSIEELLIKMEL